MVAVQGVGAEGVGKPFGLGSPSGWEALGLGSPWAREALTSAVGQ
jgi:hypothetical protein